MSNTTGFPVSIPTFSDGSTCPDLRSTASIIWSCLATIFACIWISIHPNIPFPNSTWLETLHSRLLLTFYTLFVPEAILYWALRQWDGAQIIAEMYQSRGE